MTSKHTPGPWVRDFQTAGEECVCADGGDCIVARIPMSDDELEQCSFNANLIAAAPDMYEALKEAEEVIAKWLHDFDTYQKIIDAISRAEGME